MRGKEDIIKKQLERMDPAMNYNALAVDMGSLISSTGVGIWTVPMEGGGERIDEESIRFGAVAARSLEGVSAE